MHKAIGIFAAEHIAAARVAGDRVEGETQRFGEQGELTELPAEDVARELRRLAELLLEAGVEAIGIAMPGLIRQGVIHESPNLSQMKGFPIREAVTRLLRENGITLPVSVLNDAAAVAAGIAATRGHLDRVVRVWYLGDGVGFGRYPAAEGASEGGHMVVTLDPNERFCPCGGRGHLESIMGHRAMRKRFLDLEPEEVFALAREGDQRCRDFVRLWHRALAAAHATSIHMDGPGRFYLTGPNARFVDLDLLSDYLDQMVAMNALRGNSFDVVPRNDEIAVIGAAVTARQAAGQ